MTGDTLPVLYSDDALAVIAKPTGLMAHASPMARGEDDFLVDRLRAQFARNVVLVHRLDRATSGCVLIAFDRETAAALGAQFMARGVDKTYLAVCRGWPDASGVIDYPLDGGPGKPVTKPAVTAYRRLATVELQQPSAQFQTSRYALLECTPDTGRWRQIRRHLKHISHHLIGDTSHGDGRHNLAFRMRGVHRMLLHAHMLGFAHPHSAERIQARAPLDVEFERAFGMCGWSLSLLEPGAVCC
jgi:tRNA pseudouridine65 synthase